MVRSPTAPLVAIFAASLLGCPPSEERLPEADFDPYTKMSTPSDYEDWYPESVMAPEGTDYPVRLLALPAGMEGLPGLDHAYLNHVYAQLVLLAQANLTLKQQMGTPEQASALNAYDTNMMEIQVAIDSEEIPPGLEPFHDDLTAALRLQLAYFKKACDVMDKTMIPLFESEASEIGLATGRSTALTEIQSILEREAATAKLTAAWSKMSRRYHGHWENPVRDSIYSHLRAVNV